MTPEGLTQAAKTCGFRGERRALRVRLDGIEWALDDNVLTVNFVLPPGAYATNVLRELMKTPE
jgi:tRNA pseudouridine13 synthase